METQKCLPFVLLTYLCRCQQCNVESVAMETQRVTGIVGLRTLPWKHNAVLALLCYVRCSHQYEIHLGLHVKCSILLFDVDQMSVFSAVFRESLKYRISRKSIQWKPRRPDRQTDVTKLIVTFRYIYIYIYICERFLKLSCLLLLLLRYSFLNLYLTLLKYRLKILRNK